MSFKLELNQAVQVIISGEKGHIKGRSEYSSADNQYYIRYLAADGRSTDGWFMEDELSPVEWQKNSKTGGGLDRPVLDKC